VTAFRSTRSNRSTGQAHQPAAGACRPSIRAGPGPTGSFRQQPRYSVRGGAGGGWGGGCSVCTSHLRWVLCPTSPTRSRWVLCPLHPDRAKWDDECPATHTHTHPPTPTPTTRNGGSTPAPWCHGPAASGPASPRSEKTCCRASHVPTPSPASWPGCGRTAEAWAGAGWRGGGGGARKTVRNSGVADTRVLAAHGAAAGPSANAHSRTRTHTPVARTGMFQCVHGCGRSPISPPTPPPPPSPTSLSNSAYSA
jgi:hypothetical protein